MIVELVTGPGRLGIQISRSRYSSTHCVVAFLTCYLWPLAILENTNTSEQEFSSSLPTSDSYFISSNALCNRITGLLFTDIPEVNVIQADSKAYTKGTSNSKWYTDEIVRVFEDEQIRRLYDFQMDSCLID